MNKVILIGNTVRPIELRYLPSGAAVAKTGIAMNRTWKDKNSGEQRQEVTFIDIEAFGNTAEVLSKYAPKGKQIFVEGRLKLEQWEDQSGQKRSKHIVVVDSLQLLGAKEKEPDVTIEKQNSAKVVPYSEDISEEIPF